MCGPSGIGFLYGRRKILESMPPFLGGGEMIDEVFLDHFTHGELPYKFEAGTPAIAEAIALGKAIDYLTDIGMNTIHSCEEQLSNYLFQRLEEIPNLRTYGVKQIKNGAGRAALASFNVDGIHGSDLSTLLDYEYYSSYFELHDMHFRNFYNQLYIPPFYHIEFAMESTAIVSLELDHI